MLQRGHTGFIGEAAKDLLLKYTNIYVLSSAIAPILISMLWHA